MGLFSWLRRLFRPIERAPEARAPVGKHDHLSRGERIDKYGHKHVTMRGDVVQSGPERRIADFLFRKGIPYVYEMQIPGATPDFFLPEENIIVEHWGMEHSKYREKRAMKTRLYRSRGYTLVETEKRDVKRLELALEARLRAVDPGIFERHARAR
jgi:very-short-patch-repair endonuclease